MYWIYLGPIRDWIEFKYLLIALMNFDYECCELWLCTPYIVQHYFIRVDETGDTYVNLMMNNGRVQVIAERSA